jgi:alpha-beta hydrolase superfamily lysophospholipase
MYPDWRPCLLASALAAVVITASWPAVAADGVETLTTRPGVTQGYYWQEPAKPPRAIAVLFVGGDGNLALNEAGPTRLRGNFLFQIRNALANAGLLLVFPDAPSDRSRGLDNRTDADHANDIRQVILAVKKRADLPVFVIGTSRGTVSTTNLASRNDPALVKGLILTSTIMERAKNKQHSVFDTKLAEIRVPVLAVAHKDDACYVTPASSVPRLLRALVNVPRKDSVVLSGGKPAESDPCDAKSAHGYFGIEGQAVKTMTTWIDSVLVGN